MVTLSPSRDRIYYLIRANNEGHHSSKMRPPNSAPFWSVGDLNFTTRLQASDSIFLVLFESNWNKYIEVQQELFCDLLSDLVLIKPSVAVLVLFIYIISCSN